MDATRNPESTRRPRPSASIIAVAAFQLLVGILTLILFKRGILLDYFSGQASVPPNDLLLLGELLGTAILEIVTAIGLLRLKNWARLLSLAMAALSLCACVLAVALYKRLPGIDFTPELLKMGLWVVIPVSIWWWILFTRGRVRAQFH